MDKDPGRLAGARLAALVAQMAGEDSLRGYQKRIADRTGISPSYVSKIVSGDRVSIGLDAIVKIVDTLGIDKAFFDTENLESTDYRDHLVEGHVPPEPRIVYDEDTSNLFLEGWLRGRRAQELRVTPEEASALRDIPFHRDSLTSRDIELALRGGRDGSEPEGVDLVAPVDPDKKPLDK